LSVPAPAIDEIIAGVAGKRNIIAALAESVVIIATGDSVVTGVEP
jgi:hypothetical protein